MCNLLIPVIFQHGIWPVKKLDDVDVIDDDDG